MNEHARKIKEEIVEDHDAYFKDVFIKDPGDDGSFYFKITKWIRINILYPIERKIVSVEKFCLNLLEDMRYGFTQDEVNDFYYHHSEWALLRLKALRAKSQEYKICPMCFFENLPPSDEEVKNGNKKWLEVLDKIIWSFENYKDEPQPEYPEDYDHRIRVSYYDDGSIGSEPIDARGADWSNVYKFKERVQEGIDLFAKHYFDLWI